MSVYRFFYGSLRHVLCVGGHCPTEFAWGPTIISQLICYMVHVLICYYILIEKIELNKYVYGCIYEYADWDWSWGLTYEFSVIYVLSGRNAVVLIFINKYAEEWANEFLKLIHLVFLYIYTMYTNGRLWSELFSRWLYVRSILGWEFTNRYEYDWLSVQVDGKNLHRTVCKLLIASSQARLPFKPSLFETNFAINFVIRQNIEMWATSAWNRASMW